MGKLRHGALPAPDPAAWRAAATSAPRRPRLQPGQPPPSSSGSRGTSTIDPHSLGQALEEENKAINHPCFTAAPARRQGRLPLCTAGTPRIKAAPEGSALPASCRLCSPHRLCPARCPRPRRAPGCGTGACSARRGMPEATSLGESIEGTGRGCCRGADPAICPFPPWG